MKIVAIGHQKGVGKNTFATFCSNILRERARGANIQIVNIANCLKDAAYMLYSGIGLETWHYYEEHPEMKDIPLKNGKTPRKYWLDLGSILCAYDTCLFIRQALSSADCDYLFLPDLRRVVETEFLSNYKDVYYTRVNRGTPVRYKDIDDELLDYKFSHEVDNNGTLNDLYKTADQFVSEFLFKKPDIPTLDLSGGKSFVQDKRY